MHPESIFVPVILTGSDDAELEIRRADDVISIYIDGEHQCNCDWSHNLAHAFVRALEVWGGPEDES